MNRNTDRSDDVAASRNEANMVASILGGQTQLYHELIRPYERGVYLVALSYMKNEADAEDVAQEAFLKTFCALSAFRSEAKFSTWLISITLNEARGRLRRADAVRFESLDAPDEGGISPALVKDRRETPSQALEQKEVCALLQKAVESLPPSYREVFLLRAVEELSGNEVAQTLEISLTLVKVRLHRARMMLQKQLAPQLRATTRKPKRRSFS